MIFNCGDSFKQIFTVNKDVYSGFLSVFKDTNALHTNEEFAIEKGFRGRVMHGNILNGFLSYFIGECLPNKNVIIHTQSIQYRKPVYLDDELSFEATVTEIFESVNSLIFKFTFKNAELKTVAKGQIQIGIII